MQVGLGLSLSEVSARGQVTLTIPGVVTISGTLPDAIVGQSYDASLTVTPSGSAITLDPATASAIAARGISHDGFGRFTATSVTA